MNDTSTQNNNENPKHSALFYISPKLFQNKSLKKKRLKWMAMLEKAALDKKKTERRKQCFSNLRADFTIDLLSDEENTSVENVQHKQNSVIEQQHQLQNVMLYPSGSIQLSNVPNITLIPVQNCQQQRTITSPAKRKRKAQKPKRLSQPTITNTESIVLTDDSDIDSPTVLNEPLIHSTPRNSIHSHNSAQIAHVDEEVTVSIVPRSSTAGNCTKPPVNELFPMLPDETTVHTVIANRIYELSLTKLREGLASCGVPEFANGQQNHASARRKNRINMPATQQPPTPVSLKLSSDLSISLISDDEEESVQITPEKLIQQQPHLSVQQVQLPLPKPKDTRTVPKRKKAS